MAGPCRLALGANNTAIAEKRNATVQAISGTGALRIGADFLVRERSNHDGKNVL